MSLNLLVAGVISLDTTLRVPFIPKPDSECFALSTRDAHGGAAANVAAFAALYGGQSVGLIARVGDDSVGEILISRLSQYHVDLGGTIRTPEASSTRIFTLLLPNDSKSYILNLGAHSALSRRDIPSDYLSSARAFYLAPCSPEIHADLLDFASAQRWTIYFNPGTVYVEQAERGRLYPFISMSHILFLNESEALTYSGKNTIDEAGMFLLGLGPNHVIVTASHLGSVVFSAGQGTPTVIPSKTAKVINPVGAGDAFAAGFVSEHLRTGDVVAASLNGATFGAYAVTQVELRAANPDPLAISHFTAAHDQP